jgi:hypothetical protein
MGSLEFEVLRYGLRILIGVYIDYLEPAHLKNVHAMIPIRRPVEEGVFCGPSHDDRGVVGQPLHPDVMDGKSESRGKASETLEPAANCLTVMTLTAQGVRPVKAMMNVEDAVFDQGVKVLLVDSFKVLPGDPLHYRVIHAAPPSEFNVSVVYIKLNELYVNNAYIELDMWEHSSVAGFFYVSG